MPDFLRQNAIISGIDSTSRISMPYPVFVRMQELPGRPLKPMTRKLPLFCMSCEDSAELVCFFWDMDVLWVMDDGTQYHTENFARLLTE